MTRNNKRIAPSRRRAVGALLIASSILALSGCVSDKKALDSAAVGPAGHSTDHHHVASAERLLRFHVREVRRVDASLPLRWGEAQLSPFLERTGP